MIPDNEHLTLTPGPIETTLLDCGRRKMISAPRDAACSKIFERRQPDEYLGSIQGVLPVKA